MEVDAQKVIENLLEQNKQLTFEIAVLKARLAQESSEKQDN
jgi:regulator of replication initiation timing